LQHSAAASVGAPAEAAEAAGPAAKRSKPDGHGDSFAQRLRHLRAATRRIDLAAAFTEHMTSVFEASHAAFGVLRGCGNSGYLLYLADVESGIVFAARYATSMTPAALAVDIAALFDAHAAGETSSRIIAADARSLPSGIATALWMAAPSLARRGCLFVLGAECLNPALEHGEAVALGSDVPAFPSPRVPTGYEHLCTRQDLLSLGLQMLVSSDLVGVADDAGFDLLVAVQEAGRVVQEVCDQTHALPGLDRLFARASGGPRLGLLVRLWEYNAFQTQLRFAESPERDPVRFRATLAYELLGADGGDETGVVLVDDDDSSGDMTRDNGAAAS
jgi:hypothetical protein